MRGKLTVIGFQSWSYYSFSLAEQVELIVKLTSDSGVSLYFELDSPPSFSSFSVSAKVISESRSLQVSF
jgi:hypothetical protein